MIVARNGDGRNVLIDHGPPWRLRGLCCLLTCCWQIFICTGSDDLRFTDFRSEAGLSCKNGRDECTGDAAVSE